MHTWVSLIPVSIYAQTLKYRNCMRSSRSLSTPPSFILILHLSSLASFPDSRNPAYSDLVCSVSLFPCYVSSLPGSNLSKTAGVVSKSPPLLYSPLVNCTCHRQALHLPQLTSTPCLPSKNPFLCCAAKCLK